MNEAIKPVEKPKFDVSQLDPLRTYSDAAMTKGLELLTELFTLSEAERIDAVAVIIAVTTLEKYSNIRRSLEEFGNKILEKREKRRK